MRVGYQIRATILLILLIGCLTGCAASEEQTEVKQNKDAEESLILTEPEDAKNGMEMQAEKNEIVTYSSADEISALNIPENLLAFYLVLNSKKPFTSSNEGCQEFYWDEYYWSCGGTALLFTATDFMLVDMDRDEEDELVLTGYMPETTQILDYQDGKVYSYQFVFRGMKNILPNGNYNSSSGYDVNGFYRISLDHGTYEEETLAHVEHDYYEVDGVEVSPEEYGKFAETFWSTEQVKGIDFTQELLEKHLLGDMTKEEMSVIENIEPEEMEEKAIPYATEELQEYADVLMNGKEFICVTDEGQRFFIEGNCIRRKISQEEYQILYFSIADMDGDGRPEVALTCYFDTIFILHSVQGEVRGYRFGMYDEMYTILEDGTYRIEMYGEEDYGKIISFGETDYETEMVEDLNSGISDRARYYFFSEETLDRWLK